MIAVYIQKSEFLRNEWTCWSEFRLVAAPKRQGKGHVDSVNRVNNCTQVVGVNDCIIK